MSDTAFMEFLPRLAKALAVQFGPSCETVIYDLRAAPPGSSITAIENGHISGRKVGDGLSPALLEALRGGPPHDQLCCLSKTRDGKTLKSTAVFIRDGDGRTSGIFSVNCDVTLTLAMEDTLRQFTTAGCEARPDPGPAVQTVPDHLEELIRQSVERVGRPAALMTREDKVNAIRFLDSAGAFLITRSGARICKYFGLSKYTLYSYIEEARSPQ